MNQQSSTQWPLRWQAMVRRIVRVQDESELQPILAELTQINTPYILAFVNAHAMNSIASSSSFFEAMRTVDLILRDGSGIAMLFKLLHLKPGLNLNGTDLIPRIIRLFDAQAIALYGTMEPYLSNTQEYINKNLASNSTITRANGFSDAESYITLAREQKPSLIVLGMGMPKQECIAAKLRAELNHPCLIICGGAIIDFLGGKISRAPAWMRNNGVEWLYRLVLEPRRLFKRYVLGNPLFLINSIRYRWIFEK